MTKNIVKQDSAIVATVTIANTSPIEEIIVNIPQFAAIDVKAFESLAQTANCTLYAPIDLATGQQKWEVWGKGKESRMGETPRLIKAYSLLAGADNLGGYLVAESFKALGTSAQRIATQFERTGTFNMRTIGNAYKVKGQIIALAQYAELLGVRIDGSAKTLVVPAMQDENN